MPDRHLALHLEPQPRQDASAQSRADDRTLVLAARALLSRIVLAILLLAGLLALAGFALRHGGLG